MLLLAEKPKNKRKKYKFVLQKIKIKNLSFFIKKLGQEIKIRKNPDKTGKKPQKNRKNPVKSGKIRKSSQKNLSFLIDFHSLTQAGVPFPLEQSLILNKSRSQALCSQCLSAHLRG